MAGEHDLFYLKFWVKLARWSENADFPSILARSVVRPSEKVELTLKIGSPVRAFQ